MATGSFSRTVRSIGGNALYGFIALCALLFVAQAAAGMAGMGDAVAAALMLRSDIGDLPAMPWTVVSYALVHTDAMHLLLNMLWLYAFGRIMLGYAPQRRLVRTLAGGAVSGAVCFLAFYALWPSAGPASLMGSSAAILAVATATAVDMPDLPLRLWPLGDVKLKWVVAALIALFCLGLTGSAGSTAAHAGGALCGMLMAFARRCRLRHATRPAAGAGDMRRELDTLLDKVKTSGYEALSRRDKQRLFELSYKIKQ